MIRRRRCRVAGSKAAWFVFLGGVLAKAALTACIAAAPVEIAWHPLPGETNRAMVAVTGLPTTELRALAAAGWSHAQWQDLFAVYAEQGDLITDVTVPPMLGAYRVQDETVRFEPRFPWDPGVDYRAIFRPEQLPAGGSSARQPIASRYRMPARPRTGSSTVVSAVYPSADELPENLLKFYVQFSAPMSRGHIYTHIHVRNAAGQDIELPFLEIDEELWDPSMTRLTLIIDPGRIKCGVRPLEEIGPALEAGKTFTLVIDRAWLDGQGAPLQTAFQKNFRVRPPDRDPIDPNQWIIQPPSSGSRAGLVVTFPKPLDHALAQRVISVGDAKGSAVAGKVKLEDAERRWLFIPEAPWPGGRYELLIQSTLEDLAGNNIGKSFDVDLFEKVDRHIATSMFRIPFQVN